jgi:membrane-associated phospholipid phosphatase
VAILICLVTYNTSRADDEYDYLSSGEVAGIGLGSVALGGFGMWVKRAGTRDCEPSWKSPLPFEGRLQRLLGGNCSVGKTNFLDSKRGSAITATAAITTLVATNLAWPREDRARDVLQDVFLISSGLTATKGVTDLVKGVVARQRPLTTLCPDIAAQRTRVDCQHESQSFFSGHSSSAFFAMTYLNLRLRAIMRHQLSPDDYRSWRWTSPALLYGWAAFVGWSRIDSYQHFVSDVLVGALAGYLIGELFFSFNDSLPSGTDNDMSAQTSLRITFRF